MTLEIPSNKIYDQPQTLSFGTNKLFCLIGENGSGKSSILESIFQKYIEVDGKNVICFTSGQNELFYSIFDAHKKQSSKFKPDDNNIIQSFYFDYWWVRLLVFFAVSLKRDGLTASYFNNKDYDVESMYIHWKFRVREPYIKQIKYELDREAKGEFAVESKRRTVHYNKLLDYINHQIDEEYDFDETANRIVKQSKYLTIDEAIEIFGSETNQIFTFLSHATMGWLSNIDIKSIGLYINKNTNEIEFEQLSDGEYQLLSIYALIDLFDSMNTLFLFDEIDSHVHFGNLNKLWDTLKNIRGKLISTTHISESILKNNFDDLLYVENGKIERSLAAREVFSRLSNVTGQKKYEYTVASRIKHLALLDDEVDWLIFKKLAIKKVGAEAQTILNQIVPYKRSSSYNTTDEVFGKGKLEYVKSFKENNTNTQIVTKNIFLLCDRDSLPLNQINNNMEVAINASYREIRTFGTTKTYLLSWKRLEIENYLLSKTMLECKEIFETLQNQFQSISFDRPDIFDTLEDLRIYDSKTLLHPLYKQPNGFDEAKLDELIALIPINEISEDIEKVYNFIKNKVESNA